LPSRRVGVVQCIGLCRVWVVYVGRRSGRGRTVGYNGHGGVLRWMCCGGGSVICRFHEHAFEVVEGWFVHPGYQGGFSIPLSFCSKMKIIRL